MKRWVTMLAALLAWSAAVQPAQAAPFVYFSMFGGIDTRWRLDEDKAPTMVDSGRFFQAEAPFRFPATGRQTSGTVQFYSADQGGGVDLFFLDHQDLGLSFSYSPSGPLLYQGSEDAPVFLTGTFALYDWFDPSVLYTLVISRTGFVAAPPLPEVPEPSSWAMLILGFGLMGGVLRVRAQPATA